MALFMYGTATNTGKGFFTHEDRLNFFLRGYPGDVWVIGNNEKGALWLAEKNGVEKQKLKQLLQLKLKLHKLHGMLSLMNKKQNQIILDLQL